MTAAAVPFEGPEKKLEILLRAPQPQLRTHADRRWHPVVRASGAEIISAVSNDTLDAYLLSESSLFVWPDRILMITCGRTTLLNALPEIVGIVGRQNVLMVFYERKNFLYPEDQPADFEADAAALAHWFPGRSYRLGPANADHVHVFFSSHARIHPENDVTFQMLMNDLPVSASREFSPANGSANAVSIQSGLVGLYPGMIIDSHLFSPFGFSLNGIDGACYMTVHVTPQREGSYTSFETNVIETDYGRAARQVASIFRPRRFSLVLTTSMDDRCMALHRSAAEGVPGYAVTERSLNEYDCGYAVTFVNLVEPSG